MKITYKDTDNGQCYKVHGDDYYLGEVKMDIMTQKWKIHPNFRGFNTVHRLMITKSYYSMREAGNTLYDMFYGNYGEEDFNPFLPTDLYKT
jgi:hypothetical protein